MPFKLVLALLIGIAAPAAALDDLDDLDIDAPPSPAPAKSPAASPAPDPGEIDFSELTEPAGPAAPGRVTEAAPTTLPGGFKDAWNLTTALALIRDSKREARPQDAPLKSWQSLRFSQEVSAILAGATDAPAPLRGFLERRLAALAGRSVAIDDELGLDLDASAPAPAPAAVPPSGPDPEVERLSRQLAVLDRADLARAQELARDLATRAGDASTGPRLAAAAAHGPEFSAYVMRARALLHQPPGSAWILRQLASGQPEAIGCAIDYLRDAATLPELQDALAAVAAKTVSGPAARDVAQAVGMNGTGDVLADLEAAAKDAPADVARAAGEAIGRIRQREEERSALSEGTTGYDRREAASRANQQGLPLYRAGRYREALGKFRLACELDGTEGTHFYNHGSALYRLGAVGPASDAFQRALTIGRDELPFYEMAIAALRDLGQRDKLIAFLDERSTRVRYSAIVVLLYLNLAHEHVAAGEPEKAQQAVEIALARAVPDRFLPALLVRRGDAYMLTGEPARARRHYQKALELTPDYQRALDGLLRADAWQPIGAATATSTPAAPEPIPDDDPFGPLDPIDLDAPATKPTPAPTPQASAGPKLDDLDLDI